MNNQEQGIMRKIFKRAFGKTKDRRGFDILQILFGIAVIALLAALAAPSYFRSLEEAKITTAKSDVKSLMSAILVYKADVGANPSATGGSALCTELQGKKQSKKTNQEVGPWMSTCPKTDPWGNEYTFDGTNMVVYTELKDSSVGSGFITTADLTSLQQSKTGAQ